MNKILAIALKDLQLVFRDPGSLILMLVTPFALTLAMNAAFGGGGGTATLTDIPVAIVNHDDGQLGQALVDIFASEDLATLMEPTAATDDTAARALVDADESAAAIIIPPGFSESLIPAGDPSAAPDIEQTVLELYTNPTRPVSVAIIRGILEDFLNRLTTGRLTGQVVITQLIASDLMTPQQAPEFDQSSGQPDGSTQLITFESEVTEDEAEEEFNILSYLAPSMAIFFLMFTVTSGGRSILTERDQGTLPRLLSTPTTAAQVLAGKIFGTYLTGVAQLAILITASTLLFRLNWGAPLALISLVLALVAAATAWGILLAAYSRGTGQANALGAILSITFGMASGNFINRDLLPSTLKTVSLITPNAWGLEGFTKLAFGAGLGEIATTILALLLMAAIIFTIALLAFRRQFK